MHSLMHSLTHMGKVQIQSRATNPTIEPSYQKDENDPTIDQKNPGEKSRESRTKRSRSKVLALFGCVVFCGSPRSSSRHFLVTEAVYAGLHRFVDRGSPDGRLIVGT